MAKINLLPSDLTPKKSVLKLAKSLTSVSYAAVVLFFVYLIFLISIYLIDFFTLKNLKVRQETLIASVKTYEQTEQQVSLARDRMAIIKDVWKEDSVEEGIIALFALKEIIPPGVSFSDSEISSDKNEISLIGRSSTSMAQFMTSLVYSEIYETIFLKNFSYNSSLGYRITFEGSF